MSRSSVAEGWPQVYLAIQESLDRTVALKITAASLAADELAQRRFLKEGRIVAQLNHPNIVTLYDIGQAGAVDFMAMEYVRGGNLQERIQRNAAIHNPLDIIRQVAKALAYTHQPGVIHRDVKPANILFKDDESVVLSDFGIAKALSSHTNLTETGFTAGTPDDRYANAEHLISALDAVSTQARASTRTDATTIVSRRPSSQVLDSQVLGESPFPGENSAPARVATHASPHGQQPRAAKPWLWLWGAGLLAILIWGVAIWQLMPRADPPNEWIIKILLANANNQLAAQELVTAEGDNAYETYLDVLD